MKDDLPIGLSTEDNLPSCVQSLALDSIDTAAAGLQFCFPP